MAGQSAAGVVTTFGKIAVAESGQTTAANALVDRVWMRTLRRNANVAAARMQSDFGIAPGFHHLVDPSTAAEAATLVMEDFFSATIALGACGVAVGFIETITQGDPSTQVGVGFRCGVDHVWHAFVRDCPTNVAPVTVRRDTALAALATDLHRLTLIIDGPTKTITWQVDGVTVDAWTPPAALDQMLPAGPKIMWAADVPASGDVTIRYHGGGLPQLRLLVR